VSRELLLRNGLSAHSAKNGGGLKDLCSYNGNAYIIRRFFKKLKELTKSGKNDNFFILSIMPD
jgi:hypothetical protein